MILKLKEIHQYTHQLVSSDSEGEAPFAGGTAQMKAPTSRPVSCAQTVRFTEPRAPANVSPVKHNRDGEAELLSNSQGSNTSSTAASEESERYSVACGSSSMLRNSTLDYRLSQWFSDSVCSPRATFPMDLESLACMRTC